MKLFLIANSAITSNYVLCAFLFSIEEKEDKSSLEAYDILEVLDPSLHLINASD